MILGGAVLTLLLVAVVMIAWRARQHHQTVAELDKTLRENVASATEAKDVAAGLPDDD
jgi:uncharacterized membrane protein YccC